MKTCLFLASLCSLGATALAWTSSPAPSKSASRRVFLDTAAKIVPLVIAADAAMAEDEAPVEPVVEKSDAAPVVEEEAAAATVAATEAATETAPVAVDGETDLIAKLKARSEANREKNLKLSQRSDKLSSKQFLSQYDRPSFVGVHDPVDGEKVTMLLKEDFDKMLASGKVKQTYESKVSKKTGEISDDYSRPVFVFAN